MLNQLLLTTKIGWPNLGHFLTRFLCLWDINNNSKITQKGKKDAEGNVKICLPAAQRILIVPQYM